MTQQSEMEKFFGFSMGDSSKVKVEAVKKKIKKVSKAEQKQVPSSKDQRDIEMLEKLGLSNMFVNSKEHKEQSKKEEDQNLLNTLKKMQVI